MSGWQPIESAPKDGTLIILFPNYQVGWWEFGDDKWMTDAVPLNDDKTIANDWIEPPKMWFCVYANVRGVEPTHWMQFPEPPITTERVAPASGVIHANESVSPPQGDIEDAAASEGRP